MMSDFYSEINEILKEKPITKMELAKLKVKLCKKHKVKNIPTDVEILLNTPEQDFRHVKQNLRTKATRSISGVAVVAIMSKPHKCPHGKCAYCPGGPQSFFGDVPQSYTGREPATMRAIRNHFDPYLQVTNRLEQYIASGHAPEKAELVIMGGTFPYLSKAYQKSFVMYALKAMNDFSREFFSRGEMDILRFKEFFELPGDMGDKKREKRIQQKLLKQKKAKTSLEAEQERNEKSKIRCVGMTIETRPDYGRLKHGNFALELGATRIELGIESVYDDILKRIERGHDVAESIASIQELKDIGFKLNFHYMLGLPGTSQKRDLEGLERLFSNPLFRPDMLKIYPCMVMRGTPVFDDWKAGKFSPLTTESAARIICDFKRTVPKYVRIMRIQRDIPTSHTEAGVNRTNLRQYVDQLCRSERIRCRCIRCREVGRAKKVEKVEITVMKYDASDGTEFFIAAEDLKNDVILGFTRLRFPSQYLRKEITPDSALVRELHVYGETASMGERSKGKSQHKGWGRKLLERAEDIASKHGKKKIIIISGIGVREYYRKIGYKREGPYMVKKL
jgi:elongator complex protein 3